MWTSQASGKGALGEEGFQASRQSPTIRDQIPESARIEGRDKPHGSSSQIGHYEAEGVALLLNAQMLQCAHLRDERIGLDAAFQLQAFTTL